MTEEVLINVEEIGRRIGHSPFLSKFITVTLGVEPTKRDRRAMLWTEAQFQLILVRFTEHLKKVADAHK